MKFFYDFLCGDKLFSPLGSWKAHGALSFAVSDKPPQKRRPSAIFTALMSIFAIFMVSACDLLDNSMTDYYLDNTEMVRVTGVAGKTLSAKMADGTILIPPEKTSTIGVTLSNPRNFDIRYELMGAPEGRDITARQTKPNEIEVSIGGAAEHDEYDLTLVMQSSDGLRTFPPCPIQVKCVSFETGVADFKVNGATPPAFDARGDFTVNVPYRTERATLEGISVDPNAVVEMFSGTESAGAALATGTRTAEIERALEIGNNYFYLRVTAPSSIAQGYVVTVYRAKNSDKDITDFHFAIGGKKYGAGTNTQADSGSVDGTAISVTVPYGTKLDSLAPAVSHTGDSISPDPAMARSYATPVSYTVTAANGTTQTYTVTVGVAKIASIGDVSGNLSFAKTGADISGAIKGAITVAGTDSIGAAVTLDPADYSVDALAPSDTGANTTATLRVPADKSSTEAEIVKTFDVYIKSDAKAITDFYFEIGGKKYGAGAGTQANSGSVNGTAISVTVPYGTALAGLAPVVSHTGSSIEPSAGTAWGSASSKPYTVTAEDGATQEYTVAVGVAKIKSIGEISGSLSFVKTGADISGDTIKAAITEVTGTDSLDAAITLDPADYSVDALAPSDTGATATATLRVPADKSSTEAEIVKTFDVYIKSDAKAITDFYFEIGGKKYGAGAGTQANSGSVNGTAISVTVPYGTALAGLAPVVSHTGSSISPPAGAAWGSASSKPYTVTAEDGATQEYTVAVGVAKIKSIGEISGSLSFVKTGDSISGGDIKAAITEVMGTDSLDAAITLDPADYSVGTLTPIDTGVTMTATLRVPAAKNSTGKDITKDFDVFIISDDKMITDFYFEIGGKKYGVGAGAEANSGSVNGSASGIAITITVPYGTALAGLDNLKSTVSHTGSSISSPAGTTWASPGKTYTVTAEDGTTQTYTVTVSVAKIKSIGEVRGSLSFKTGASISGDTIKAAITEVTGTDSVGAAITLDPADYSVDNLTPSATGVTVSATLRVPADKSSTGAEIAKTFAVYIKSAAKEITEFYFKIGGKKYGVAASGAEANSGSVTGTAITITVPYGTALAGLDNLKSTVSHTGSSISPPAGTTWASPGKTYTVMAEDGTTQTYTVTVSVAKIKSIEKVSGNLSFVKTGSAISGGAIKAAITEVTGTDSVGAAITLDPADYSVDNLTPSATGVTVSATLRVPADKSSTGAEIAKTFAVYIKSAAKEITEFYFKIGGKKYGVAASGAEANSGSVTGTAITITVPYGTALDSLDNLKSTVAHTGSSISPLAGTTWASPGKTYTVTAEDGTTQTYTVTVSVAKIKSIEKVSGNLSFVKTGTDISGDIKGAITVTGADSIDAAITLDPADYSVDALTPIDTGVTMTATLRVPAAKSSTGKEDITKTFAVYIKSDGKAITEFYFEIGGKKYGVGDGTEDYSGSASGIAITITVPYGTALAGLDNLKSTVSHTGSSISSPAGTTWASPGKTYTVTAEDGTTQTYTVTVSVAKIKSIGNVSGNLSFKTEPSISGDTIKAAITEVTGIDSLGTAITLDRADYSVDNLTPNATGANEFATLRVPADKSSTGKEDITKDFAVYIKRDGKAITEFYFEIGGKKYGVAASGAEANSGSVTGTAITVTVPYGTTLASLAPEVSFSLGSSISPPAGTAWGSSSSKTYRVTAEDDSIQDYTVTVSAAPGITINGIIEPSLLTFSGVPSSVTAGQPITITTSGGAAGSLPVSWYIEITGPESKTATSDTFTAPTKPGFYNVTVIVTANGFDYSGSFTLTVQQ